MEELDVVVIGAGFAGLGTGAALRGAGVRRLAIVEQGAAVGHFWSTTYDRLHLHSPWHDMPHDGGENRSGYAMYKSRDDVQCYLGAYARHHGLGENLRFGMRVLGVKPCGAGRGDVADWRITTTRGEMAARYVAVATAVNRTPHEPVFAGRERFEGTLLHSAAYQNAAPFRGQRVLVVGSGNSAAEIALDLVQGGAAAVSLWVRGARHFVRLRTMTRCFRLFRALGQMSAAKVDARHAVTWGTPAFDGAIAPMDRMTSRFSVDLSRFGIRRPALGPARETFTYGRIPTYDVGAIDEIARGRIRVIDGNARPIECFEPGGLRIGGDRERFDAVILGTGFRTGLEEFVDASLLGPVRWLRPGPLTDGRCRSTVAASAFFPGFDPTPNGGLSLGRWGWEVGTRIAEELR